MEKYCNKSFEILRFIMNCCNVFILKIKAILLQFWRSYEINKSWKKNIIFSFKSHIILKFPSQKWRNTAINCLKFWDKSWIVATYWFSKFKRFCCSFGRLMKSKKPKSKNYIFIKTWLNFEISKSKKKKYCNKSLEILR